MYSLLEAMYFIKYIASSKDSTFKECNYFSVRVYSEQFEYYDYHIKTTTEIKNSFDLGPPYNLYFRVRFYVSDPAKLIEEYTRLHSARDYNCEKIFHKIFLYFLSFCYRFSLSFSFLFIVFLYGLHS